MKLVDLNILLYVLNKDAPRHREVRAWWEGALASDEPIGLSWIVLLGFLRLATSPRVFPNPISPEDAIARVDAWLSHPNVRLVVENERQWPTLKELVADAGTAGNLTTDAHLAALAISHGAVLVSCDADFGRFRTLRWQDPTANRRAGR